MTDYPLVRTWLPMISLTNIHSVTDFQRNPKALIGKLEASNRPIVLTVNGKAELVVQDAESYQRLLDKVEAAEDLEAIRRGLEQALTGQGRPAQDFFAEFEAKHGLWGHRFPQPEADIAKASQFLSPRGTGSGKRWYYAV